MQISIDLLSYEINREVKALTEATSHLEKAKKAYNDHKAEMEQKLTPLKAEVERLEQQKARRETVIADYRSAKNMLEVKVE